MDQGYQRQNKNNESCQIETVYFTVHNMFPSTFLFLNDAVAKALYI